MCGRSRAITETCNAHIFFHHSLHSCAVHAYVCTNSFVYPKLIAAITSGLAAREKRSCPFLCLFVLMPASAECRPRTPCGQLGLKLGTRVRWEHFYQGKL